MTEGRTMSNVVKEVRRLEDIDRLGRAEYICRQIDELFGRTLHDDAGNELDITVSDLRYLAEQLRDCSL
jgi:hypothetical protein